MLTLSIRSKGNPAERLRQKFTLLGAQLGHSEGCNSAVCRTPRGPLLELLLAEMPGAAGAGDILRDLLGAETQKM